MTGRTAVHTQEQMLAQRRDARLRAQCSLSGMQLYAQIAIGLSLYLFDHVSTPGYLSLLLMLPYLALLCALAQFVKKRAGSAEDPFFFAVGKRTGRMLMLPLILIHLMDALLLFFSLCAIAGDVMPDMSPMWVALFIALVTALSLSTSHLRQPQAQMAHMLRWLVAGMLGFCMLAAIPHGSAAHFFPLLGYGPGRIVRGGCWMCGSAAGAVWPMLSPAGTDSADRRQLFPALMRGWGAGVITMLFSVWLMPVYFMARPETLGWRLLVLTNMTPSVAAWSLEVVGLMLLMLLCLSASVSQAAGLTARCVGKRQAPPLWGMIFTLCLIPAGAFALPGIQRFLTNAAPWRGAAALAVLLVMAFGAAVKKEKSPAKEDAA